MEQTNMINEEAFAEFILHRKELKKPLTPLAEKKARKKIGRHHCLNLRKPARSQDR